MAQLAQAFPEVNAGWETRVVTIGGVAAVLLAVATIASWIPARRVLRVDPATALRGD